VSMLVQARARERAVKDLRFANDGVE